MINSLIALYSDRPDRHKMSAECHTKVLRISLKGIKTNYRSIAPELIFCCFCLAEICSAKSRAMLTEIKSTFKSRYNAQPVLYGHNTWSRGVSWSHFSTRNDFKKQPSLYHRAYKQQIFSMIIGHNNDDNRHIPSWCHHQKASFSTYGAMQSTLVHIAEQMKKLAFYNLPTLFRFDSTPRSSPATPLYPERR